MRRVLLSLVIGVLGAYAIGGAAVPVAVATEPSAAPEVADQFVLRPRMTTTAGRVEAGSAFAIVHEGRRLVLTAFHLLGPGGGLPSQIAADQVEKVVQSMAGVNAFGGSAIVVRSTKVLPLPGAHPMGDDAAGDLLIFEVDAADSVAQRLDATKTPPLAPGKLASAAPKVGDRVWMAAKVINSPERSHPATVVQSDDKWLFYELDRADLDLSATNGSPVLNAAGEVVGVQLGGGVMEDGKLVGAGNPLPALKRSLATVLKP